MGTQATITQTTSDIRLQANTLHRTAIRLATAVMVATALISARHADLNLTLFFLIRQDCWLLAGGAALLALCAQRLPNRDAAFHGTWRLPMFAGSILASIALIGHYWILSGYDMSRDEQMATFDATAFASGHLVAPLPAFWREHADALNTMFMYPAEHHAAWISAYLPLNAAIRALIGSIAPPAFTGPLMTLLGAIALWNCARRIWPHEREAAVLALLLYLGSAQVLINGMTAYAMPAHLALNLCWLLLFLRRDWRADVAALMVGFIAIGLHQPLMHPMFAGPLLFLLVREKDWRRASIYALGYALIGAFWLWWPNWMWTLVQAGANPPRPEGVDYFTRLIHAMRENGGASILMVANLLRFAAWQHLLLIPLMILGIKAARKDRLAGALASGVLLTIIVMTIILPYQGHGFGYRYLHGLIGNCIILAVYGWQSLGKDVGQWRTLLLRTSAAGLLIILPVQTWMAHAFYTPYAKTSAKIGRINADYVVIGGNDAPFSADLVINPPLLNKRPVRLLREMVTPDLVQKICADHASVAIVETGMLEPISRYFRYSKSAMADRTNSVLEQRLKQAGCQASKFN